MCSYYKKRNGSINEGFYNNVIIMEFMTDIYVKRLTELLQEILRKRLGLRSFFLVDNVQ